MGRSDLIRVHFFKFGMIVIEGEKGYSATLLFSIASFLLLNAREGLLEKCFFSALPRTKIIE